MSRNLAPLSLALLAVACTTAPSGDAPGYRQLHAKIFSQGCANEACHSGDKGIANLSFGDLEASYAALVDTPPSNGAAATAGLVRVKPGDAAASFLYMKLSEHADALTARSFGAAMPLSGIEPPGERSLAAIKAWIDAGAPLEGADFEADLAEHHHEDDYVMCDAGSAEEMHACFEPTPDDGEYVRLYTPPMTIPAHREIQLCSEIDLDISEPLLINRGLGQQMSGGHHIAVFTTLAPTGDSAPVDCDDVDMSKLRFVMGAGGAGGLDTDLPDDVAVRVLPGQRLLVQSHYINSTDQPTVVMDAVDLQLTTAERSPVLADSFAVIDSDFEVPARAEGFQRVKECLLEKDYDIHILLGHTHEHGVLFRFDLLRGDAEPELLYYATDGKLLRSNPEVKIFRDPYEFKAGDRLRMTCQWDNETDAPLGWPAEMCVTFMYYSPGEGFLTCDTHDVSPVVLGGDGEHCRVPDAPGNDAGVGKTCTAEGGECVGNMGASFCLAPFDTFNNYCSIIGCTDDAQCGAGASCVTQDAGSACILDAC